MDHGAHYVNTDLQVHSPRDPNWKLGCSTDDEREQFAREFIASCRTAGLGAVAITDHHDFGFVPWIKAASEAERDTNGDLVPPPERIVVFPGLELTLAVPCQALIIFGADFPFDRLAAVLDKLGVDPAADGEIKAKAPLQLGFDTFQELYDRLDETPWLRGQYVVLPNVTDGGHQTLMRRHMQSKYRDMPCVGGYLDGPVTAIGQGNRTAFDGGDPNRGYRRIALMQTSDARSLDKLGSNTTWIKWSEPTAEAIRQACLAQESRIAHTEPRVPGVTISRLRVSNSRFLGPVDLELNPQYNALIGGRGTGKSTCLEYLRWALCDQSRGPETGESGIDEGRRHRLIEQTLGPVDGHVEVHFVLNAIPHVVRRYAVSRDLLLKIGPGELRDATEDEVRSLLPIEAYSQRQLSSVGVRLDELQRFVTGPIRGSLDWLADQNAELERAIRENFVHVQRERAVAASVRRDRLSVESTTQQIENMRAELQGLSDADKAILAAKGGYDDAAGLVASWTRRAEQARDETQRSAQTVAQLRVELRTVDSSALPEQALLSDLRCELEELLDAAQEKLAAAADHLRRELEPGSATHRRIAEWENVSTVFAEQYGAALARSSAHASRLAELESLENRKRELQGALDQQAEQLGAFGDPSARHSQLRTQWQELQRERTKLLMDQCGQLTTLSDGAIRATIKVSAGTTGLEQRFKDIVRGSSLRGSKVEKFLDGVASADDPLAEWHLALDELELLVLAAGDPASAPDSPSASSLSVFSDADLEKIVSRVSPETLLDLSLLGFDDHPVFDYRSKEGEYIPFADASAGQQATALLHVLLSQSGPPLIIDQPEDDLDSQVIVDVVDAIWIAKKERQLVFASHNANLVVNGDAELVVCCDYRDAGDHSAGRIKLEGAIDVPAVCDEITVVMEGGEKAFRLRKEKYGF